jgi:hypothetical protein
MLDCCLRERREPGGVVQSIRIVILEYPSFSMNEYLCITLLAKPGEAETAFKSRLAAFWTHMLRNKPDDYEKVYAEASRFDTTDGRVSRQYMAEVEVIDMLTAELTAHGIAVAVIDPDDTYSKYEATSPDWFQIEH